MMKTLKTNKLAVNTYAGLFLGLLCSVFILLAGSAALEAETPHPKTDLTDQLNAPEMLAEKLEAGELREVRDFRESILEKDIVTAKLYVQAGAFEVEKNALTRQQMIENLGYETEIKSDDTYKVLIEAENEEEGHSIIGELNSENIEAFLVEYEIQQPAELSSSNVYGAAEQLFVQAGFFELEENARARKKMVENLGYESEIRVSSGYRVLIETEDEEKGQNIIEELRSEDIMAFIVEAEKDKGEEEKESASDKAPTRETALDMGEDEDENQHSTASAARQDRTDNKIDHYIEMLAEEHDKEVVFMDRPAGSLESEVRYDDFAEALDSILAHTPYQFTYYGGRYYIGEFAFDSAEFAARSERVLYEPQYLLPSELDQRLSVPEVRTSVLSESGHLMVQGLPEDVQKAVRTLELLDREENPYHVEFQLSIIDLKQIEEDRFELSAAELGLESDDPLEFIAARESLQLFSSSYLERLELQAETAQEREAGIARPALVTALGEPGRLGFQETAYLLDQADESEFLRGLEIELTPLQLAEEGSEVRLSLEMTKDGSSYLGTTAWVEAGEKELIGFMSFLQERRMEERSGRRETIERERQFAIYVEAVPRGTLTGGEQQMERTENSDLRKFIPAVNAGGIEQMIFPEDEEPEIFWPGSYQLLFDGTGSPDVDIFHTFSGGGPVLNFTARRGDEYLSGGADFSLWGPLMIGGRFIKSDEDLKLAPAFTDTGEIAGNLRFNAGFYPFAVDLDSGEWKSGEGWLALEYSFSPLSFRGRINSGFRPETLRLEMGMEATSSLQVVGGVAGGFDDIFRRQLLGLRFEF